MKRPKKGPEINLKKLKSGDVKVPAALSGLYRELKGQHLLPIVGLLVIGLIAIPILLGGGSSDRKTVAIHHQGTSGAPTSKPAALKVTQWTPGLLDYKKSLRGAHATNPFAPKVVSSEASETGSEEVEAAPAPPEIEPVSPGAGSPTSEPPSTPEPISPSPSPSPSERQGEGKKEAENAEAITLDVQVTTVHEDGGIDRNPVRRDLEQLTKLPSEATPALTYVGPSADGTKALMAVSSEVTAMIGDSNCVVAAKPCSLLALQLGAPETIVYGKRGLTYRIELIRIGDHTYSPDNAKPKQNGNKKSAGTGSVPASRRTDALVGVAGGRIVER